MSFILDALKKIEQDKRRADDAPAESIAVSGSRLGARQPVLAMAAIAVASALLTAAAVSFLSGRGAVDSAASPTVGEAAPPPRADAAAPVELDGEAEAVERRESAPEPTVREASVRVAEPEPEPEPEPDPVPVADEAPLEDGDAAEMVTDIADNEMQPIRIVGRERALLDALGVEDAPGTVDDEPEVEEPLPEDFPELVLQGTSMIGTDAVAVISDQRVFEGDRIEGALVVRIGEREVELELDGRRFTLRL